MTDYEKLLLKLQECRSEVIRLSQDNSSLGIVSNNQTTRFIDSAILSFVQYMGTLPKAR